MALRLFFQVLSAGSLLVLIDISPPARAETAPPADSDALDFLVMNVCVDANDRPTAQNPLNTNSSVPPATRQRNLRPGESVPYYAASWTAPARGVSRRYCVLSSISGTDQTGARFPIVIAWTDHSGDGHWSAKNNVSAMTVREGYASDMGSTGGGILSVNFGEDYLNPVSKGMARFSKAWVFFPEKLIPENEIRYGDFSEQLANFTLGEFNPDRLPPPSATAASSRLRSYFSLQARQVFGYGPHSSIRLDSLIENKYDGRDAAGTSPGAARAMERCYFTRELGESRWEAWKRDDYHADHLLASASKLYGRGACGMPAGLAQKISPHCLIHPVQVVPTPQGRAYAQKIEAWDDQTQRLVEHTWYLVDCADWTHVVPQPPFDPAAVALSPENILLRKLLTLFQAD